MLRRGGLHLSGALNLRSEVVLVGGGAELDGVVQLEQVLLVDQARDREMVAKDSCGEMYMEEFVS